MNNYEQNLLEEKLARLEKKLEAESRESSERGKELKDVLRLVLDYDDLVAGAVSVKKAVSIAIKDISDDPLSQEDLVGIEAHLNNYIVLYGKIEAVIASYEARCTQVTPFEKKKKGLR